MVPAKYSPTGKRQMIIGSARKGTNTRESVAQQLAQKMGGKPGEVLVPSRETVETFLTRWLESVEARVRPKTLEGYAYAVNRLILPHVGAIKLQALEPQHVVTMMRRLKADGRAPRSVGYSREVLCIALHDAKRWKLINVNVADREHVDPPRIPKREVDAYDAKEVAKILAAVVDTDDRVLLATIATFGLRIGEALGLKWKDLDLASGTLRIVRAVQRQQAKKGLVFTEVKTSRSRRGLLIPEGLVRVLQEHHRRQLQHKIRVKDVWQENDLVFPSRIGTPQDPRNVLRALHVAEDRAELPRKGLHKLRSSAATILLTSGVPIDVVSDMLGHSSISFTAQTYIHYVVRRQEQAAKVMDGMILDSGALLPAIEGDGTRADLVESAATPVEETL